ncbi:MAG: tetratricopeptide repeat protein [Firmicutes bacterium]|nr:tetratricopeptide repeat protein [Bacillota bacterium]
MKDPYKVLNVNKNASKEEIKRAYKVLVKKYHPDQYRNNPLSDLAEEKLREVNEAYNKIMNNNDTFKNNSYSSNSYNNNYNNVLDKIRYHIERNNLFEAEKLLESVNIKNAEWNFLKGVLLLKKGWYNEAYNYLKTAVRLDPTNMEYKRVLNNINMRNTGYRNVGNDRGYPGGTSACDICSCLICTDCCCECMGGDFLACP